MKTHAKLFSPFHETPRAFAPTNSSHAFWSRDSIGKGQNADSHCGAQKPGTPLIYAVDDLPCLTELYALLLEATGHRVRTFNNRRTVLAALKTEKPALLITDFRNASMPTDSFLQECVAAHPQLRILMATGSGLQRAWLSSVTPDRFLQKPFSPEELLREVKAALAEAPANCTR